MMERNVRREKYNTEYPEINYIEEIEETVII